jgi:hypothetical protein
MATAQIQTVKIAFKDGGYYEIKPDGDTIFGEQAHKVMHEMNRRFNYGQTSMEQRINFILSNYSLPD